MPLLRLGALLSALLLVLGATGCALPHGSFARPVRTVDEGSVLLSAGGLVPFAAVGAATTNDADFGDVADEVTIVPAAAFDYALGGRSSFGVEVSTISPLFSDGSGDPDILGVFVNPRFEIGLGENVSFTVDGNIGYFRSEDADDDGDTVEFPFFAPTVGTRIYLPTGFGGLIWSQQLSTALITVALPGSLAYDLPIPIGDATLHLFPEVRYDPTFVLTSEASGVIALFSGGLTLMLEL